MCSCRVSTCDTCTIKVWRLHTNQRKFRERQRGPPGFGFSLCVDCARKAHAQSPKSDTPTKRAMYIELERGSLCEYMGHDVSNMRGFDSYRLLTLSLAALMTRISSAMIEGAHTSAGAATLARTVPFWGRFRSPREPTAGPCRGCLLPSATNTAPSRHHLQAVLCDGWDVQTPPSWLLRPQTRELYGWS